MRQPIVDSWRRSLDSGLDPVGWLAPIESDPSEIRERWLDHPLGSFTWVLRHQLETVAEDLQSLIVVSDATGLLLYVHGSDWLKERAAADMNFLEGARWNEAAAGTNAIGTALAADHALQVFASEHFNQREHRWTCSAAPVHDPLSGRIVGIVDLTGPLKTVHPASLPLVTGAARTIEQSLVDDQREHDARLRRRYGDLATRTTDLLVSGDGRVLAGGRLKAYPKPLAVPAGGGGIVMDDGSVATAEPLGQGEAYLVRRLGSRRFGSAPLEAVGRAEERAHELAREQAALRRVATLVARESSPGRLFAVVAEEVARIVDVPLVRLVRYDADGSGVRLVGGWSERVDPIAVGARWPLDGPGVLASVWRSGRSARLDDYTDVPGQAAAVVREAGMRSAVASPVVVEGRLWGAITVLSPRPEPLPESAEARLADFTELVATAIANGDARDDLRQLFDEQAALRRVATLVAVGAGPGELFAGVAEEVVRVLAVPTIMLARFEPEGVITVLASVNEPAFKAGSRWPLDGPSVPLAVRDRSGPARIDDYTGLTGTIAAGDRDSGVIVTAGVPVIVDGDVWGVIRVGARDNASLPHNIEERLQEFTELLAIAIANGESRDRLRRLAEQQAALRRVATLVAGGVAIDTLCQSVVDEIAGSLDVETVSVDQAVDADSLKVIASYNNPNWATGVTLPLAGSSGSASVIRTGRVVRIDDYDALPGTIAARARRTGLASSLNIPVVVDGSVWGVIGLGLTARQRTAPDTEERVRDFAALLATAISNARAHERVTRLAEEQAALRRVATLVAEGATPSRVFEAVRDEIARMFDLPITILMRYDADGMATMVATHSNSLRPVGSRWHLDKHDTSSVARVFSTGRPARSPDLLAGVQGPISEAARAEGVRFGVGVPVVVDGALWGAVSVGAPGPAPPPADLEERLEEFTHLLATAIANAESRGELAASRARVIVAADEARRRIERDLHDGAQQQLVTLALGLRATEARIPPGLDALRGDVGRFAERLTTVVEELREMSRGIHPAILTEGGLSPAVEALALRSPVPVKLNVGCEGRLPARIEVAIYYVLSEALTNAAKHADASQVTIDLETGGGTLSLTIRDDGAGGADASGGSGLMGLKDRVEALGGTIQVASPPGRGTRLDVAIPLDTETSRGSDFESLSPA